MTQGETERIYKNAQDCIQQIYHREGIPGFFRGAMPRMMNIVPMTGISFAVYETIKTFLFHGHLEDFDVEDML